ncbi:MAG: hypothetical protein UCJ19_06915, partial [Oscillospiraceae bacterium]|nr:hypothetical protein [Oscillospiraceae bacterium]
MFAKAFHFFAAFSVFCLLFGVLPDIISKIALSIYTNKIPKLPGGYEHVTRVQFFRRAVYVARIRPEKSLCR